MVRCTICGARLAWGISGVWFHDEGWRDGDHEAAPAPGAEEADLGDDRPRVEAPAVEVMQ